MTRLELKEAVENLANEAEKSDDIEVIAASGILFTLIGSLIDGSTREMARPVFQHSEQQLKRSLARRN